MEFSVVTYVIIDYNGEFLSYLKYDVNNDIKLDLVRSGRLNYKRAVSE